MPSFKKALIIIEKNYLLKTKTPYRNPKDLQQAITPWATSRYLLQRSKSFFMVHWSVDGQILASF